MENFSAYELLSKVGLSCFAEHYYDFKFCTNNAEVAKKIFLHNPTRKESGNKTRVSKAKKIFKNRLEKEALQLIINSSSKVSPEIKQLAQEILSKENNEG